MLANITSESSHCFWKGNRNSGHRLCIMVCPSFWEDYYMLIYTHCWELMNSVGSRGSSSLPHDEGGGLSLCERLSWGYDGTHCRVTFNCCCGDFSATSSSLNTAAMCEGFLCKPVIGLVCRYVVATVYYECQLTSWLSLAVASGDIAETQSGDFYLIISPLVLSRLLSTSLHPLLGTGEFSGE